ncbi:MAG: hypothetical protein IPO07_26860 [Haliscomenobacter sp.]|nr:choice-of-anchor Q domain-containing protein [Haliscomenobacter sp.]MBK9492018.1 hypothetical protein [Haliscomenobacter sp.]
MQDNNGATNNGIVDASTTYNSLITAITTAGGPTYQYRQIDPLNNDDGGEPGGNIRQGFLFNPNRVSFVDIVGGTSTSSTTVSNMSGIPTLSASPGRIDPTNAAFNGSRKPLIGQFTFNGQRVFVLGVHLIARAGGDPLFGKNQPPILSTETQRQQQATIVKDFVASILAIDPNANVVVGGFLNDYEYANPVNILETAPLTNLTETLPANERYGYNFQGNSNSLSHILVSSNLANNLMGNDIVHLASEFSDQITFLDPIVAQFLLAPPCPASGILYVNASAANGGDGMTWGTAYNKLQDAITLACGCTGTKPAIWVARGTYYPTADESGNLSPSDPRNKTFAMKSEVGIYGGFVGNEAANYDLALRDFVTNETILSGDIDLNNTTDNGNAYNVLINVNTNSTAILDGFTVTGGYYGTELGFPDRRARGSAMYNYLSSPTIRNCIFTQNVGFYGNTYNYASSTTYTNCVFVQNDNNALFNEGAGTVSLINCTLSANARAIFNNDNGTSTIVKNSIIWGNTEGIGGPGLSNVTVTYSIVQGGVFTGTGNLSQDPLFVNAAGSNLRLLPCSPAIDAGTAAGAPPIDLDGNPRPYVGMVSLVDMGAYEYQGDPMAITLNDPTVTQPTCALPTGTIVVNATSSGIMEYSVDNGANWQSSATFGGLAPGNYNIKVRLVPTPACEVVYTSNPVMLINPFSVTTTDTWTGCVSTDWAVAGNWRMALYPRLAIT